MTDPRISFREAIRLIEATILAGPVETIAIECAHGRVTASPVVAMRDSPPFDMAAMDGFAIAFADLIAAGERSLTIGTPQFAGDVARALEQGEARPIATGAAVPLGAGAVLTKETATLVGSSLLFSGGIGNGANIRRRGEDARIGEPVLTSGRRIHPAAVGALCAYGVTKIAARRSPRIAIVTLGSEIAAVGLAERHQVIDANGPMVAAMLADMGCVIVARRSVADDKRLIAKALTELSDDVDLIVTTGGASVGDRDLVRAAIEAIGGIVHFHGVEMRPGKPALFATYPNGCTFFGLPGNPVAALIAARFFVATALRGKLGLPAETPLQTLDHWDVEEGPARILKVAYSVTPSGTSITILPGQQSHILRPLLAANAWLIRGGGEAATLYPLYDSLP